jgi:hypothetical protein
MHFRTAMNNDCNGIQSPIIKPSATSTMSMYVNYILQTGNADRASIRAVDAKTGEKFQLTPTAAPYNTTGDRNLLCDDLGNHPGWSGSFATWRQANFDLSPYAGREIRIEARESTDSSTTGSQGFWLDQVQISNATQINCDTQSQTCAALPAEVSPDGSPVPLTIGVSGTDLVITFSESTGASSYNLYRGSLQSLQQGIYDHAALPGLCGFLDGAAGDGSVEVTVPTAAIEDGSYLLAVAESGAGESPYGTATGGTPVPLALNSCP